MSRYHAVGCRRRTAGWVMVPAVLAGLLLAGDFALAQSGFGEIEGRPAPVSRRQCLGGTNADALCNDDADCPGSTCRTRNLYNITVSVRFDATAAQLTAIENAFEDGSELLFDATDGQAQFGQVSIFNDASGNNGHYWITTAGGCGADTGSWGLYSGGNIDISYGSLTGANGPECVAHEFAHLTFDVRDEYESKAVGCGGWLSAAQCPDSSQGTNSSGEGACLMECCARIGDEFCWGQASGDNLASGNHDATNVTEQSRCRSNRSCWDQIGWSWPSTIQVPVGAPDPGSGGQIHDPVTFFTPADTARLVLVLDRSGSMASETPTRLERLQAAALDVVTMAEDGVELGLVSFSTTATDEQVITALGANRTAYTTPINNLTASGATHIGDGLRHARNMIMNATGVTAQTAIILMTDGRNNQPSGSAATDLQNAIDDLLADGIEVYVTCTGGDTGLDSQCAEIATGTNGTYVDSASAAELPQRFVSFFELFRGRHAASSFEGSFAKPPQRPYTVEVEKGVRVATFAIHWDHREIGAEIHVIDPSGTKIGTLPMPLGRYVRVKEPEPGTWQIVVESHGYPPGADRFLVTTFIDNPLINVPAAVRHSVVQPGEPFEVCARPLQDVPLAGVKISGHVTTPSGNRLPIDLLDDGGFDSKSGDEIENDGTYCAKFTETFERGAYLFKLLTDAREVEPVKDNEPGVEWVDIDPVDFQRLTELSATVDDSVFERDHFKCYKVQEARRYWRWEYWDRPGSIEPPRRLLRVKKPGKPLAICNPTEKNGEDVVDWTAHLKCYGLEDPPEGWQLVRDPLEFHNQFGEEEVKLGRPLAACVPTIKDREKSRLDLPWFVCSEAESEKETWTPTVNLKDQFGKSLSLVENIRMMCTPVEPKTWRPLPHEIPLVCYAIEDLRSRGKFQGRQIETDNYFGEERLIVLSPELLCVPSVLTQAPKEWQ